MDMSNLMCTVYNPQCNVKNREKQINKLHAGIISNLINDNVYKCSI